VSSGGSRNVSTLGREPAEAWIVTANMTRVCYAKQSESIRPGRLPRSGSRLPRWRSEGNGSTLATPPKSVDFAALRWDAQPSTGRCLSARR